MHSAVQQTRAKDDPSIHPAGITAAEAAAMLAAALNIFDRWGLTSEQSRTLLGSPSPRTFQRWKSRVVASVPVDTIWRLGDILGIHKALKYMFADPARGYAWIKKPNGQFHGKSALEVMLAGSPANLAMVRAYLDAERGGW
jgi:hypothetical protein